MQDERVFQLVLPSGDELTSSIYGDGPALILVHGFPLDGSIWNPQIAHLVAQGWQVIVPDLRGFGRSSMGQPDFSIADLANDVEMLREHVVGEAPIRLIGLSMGGYVAFEYWRRWSKNLAGLVLCNTKPTSDSEAARNGRLDMAQKALREGTWPAVSPMLERLVSEHTRTHDQETTNALKVMMARVPAETVFAAQNAMANRRDFTMELPRLNVRTLVIAGELDPIAPPSEGAAWSAKIPSATFHSIEGAGHLPQIEAPETLNNLLSDFLRTT